MIKFLIKFILSLIIVAFAFMFLGMERENKNIIWGMNFSQKYASQLSSDYRKTYLALLDDMGVKNIRVAMHWDLIEKQQGVYDFSDLDWQITQASQRGVKIIPVIGMKTTRWPECHIPQWAGDIGKERQQEAIKALLEKIVLRYKDNESIEYWQIENEPFFSFGQCPWQDEGFLRKEIELTRSLDKKRGIILTDSGEGSLWFKTAQLADVVAVTTYRNAWFSEYKKYIEYPFPPTFYNRKMLLIKALFGKDVFCGEFQAEPWGPAPTYELPYEEQLKSMDLNRFKDNISYAKKTDYKRIYLWGGEWMFWAKEKGHDSMIWEEAKKLFKK